MSADNGVYILKTPARFIKSGEGWYTNQKGFEYRVAHCQAIDNLEYSDLYLPMLFGDSPVFNSYEEAMELAKNILNDLPVCEYGICDIEHDQKFLNMSSEEARFALNSHVFGPDQHPYEERTINVKSMDTDIRLKFPTGKEIVLQWRIENGSLDICLPENEGVDVVTWQGIDMTPSKPLAEIEDGHVRVNCGQLVLELGESYIGN
jgi:hypothetical protein